MKARKISNPYKKGNEYARKMSVRFFLSLMMLLAIVFVVGMFMDPDSFLCISGFGGTSLATMMIIGDVVAHSHYDRSELYNPAFTTEFREATK